MEEPYVIGFLTDFGLKDPYVGICKAVIASVTPKAKVIDITHFVNPQDLVQAALYLKVSLPSFPARTIFLAVVDPGVGSKRAPMVVTEGQRAFVGPDNGIFSLAIKDLENPVFYKIDTGLLRKKMSEFGVTRQESSTFHGRDIFSPAAALLARNVPALEFCTRLSSTPKGLQIPDVVLDDSSIKGSILYFDHFGNGATNITENHLRALSCNGNALRISISTRAGNSLEVPFGRTFSSVEQGSPVAYVNSFGYLEVAVNGGNAREKLGLEKGDAVMVTCRN